MKIGAPEILLLTVIAVIALGPILRKFWKKLEKFLAKRYKKQLKKLALFGGEVEKTIRFLAILVIVAMVAFMILLYFMTNR